jgi:hypothetical protein
MGTETPLGGGLELLLALIENWLAGEQRWPGWRTRVDCAQLPSVIGRRIVVIRQRATPYAVDEGRRDADVSGATGAGAARLRRCAHPTRPASTESSC